MKLLKQLTLVDIFCFATGAMVSSGLFILPGLAHAMAGPAVILSYLLAGLLAITGALSIAEMATAMPRAGGDYFFISRSLGPAMGTISGLLTWFSLAMKSAFALVGMSAFTVLFLDLPMEMVGAALCLVFLVLNILGARESSRLQVMLVGFLVTIMLLYLARGLPAVDVTRFADFAPGGAAAVFATAGFVFTAYGGLLNIASLSEEVRDYRQIPVGLILSYVVVTILYFLMVFVTVGVLDPSVLDGSLTPISEGAAAFMGRPGFAILGLGAILAFVSTANAGMFAASRYLLALSRDSLLPGFLASVNRRFRTPHAALLATALTMIAVLFLELEILVKATSTSLILPFILANISVIVLRESRVQNYRPTFRAPLYPWLQAAGVIGFILLVIRMGSEAVTAAAALVLGGLFFFVVYGRRRNNREHALLHLVERLTSNDLSRGMLESELKEIIREKDDICLDRLDTMIEKCPVLDLPESLSPEDFFRVVAGEVSGRLGLDARETARQLLERERESSTVISPGVAIPHLVVPGSGRFEIVLARCRAGIPFRPGEEPVTTAFVMFGSLDERNFHLRTLSAIAQVLQNRGFQRKWREAKNEEVLRNLVLLADRARQCACHGGRPERGQE